jgi:hypothetical protein
LGGDIELVNAEGRLFAAVFATKNTFLDEI